MIPKPKFELLDWVEMVFEGQLEGETVRVKKRLLITGVEIVNTDKLQYFYTLVERFENDMFHGKKYNNIFESQIIPLEPVINEILKAQNKT
jgi:hypothetical protein